MTIKSVIATMAMAVGMACFAADPMDSQSTVEQGKWCNDFPAALEYAEANNIPMLVFWANPGCGQCEKLEKACKENDFKAWQADRKLVMVFAYGKSSATQKAAYTWIKTVAKLKEYPFIGVYWKSNTKGATVEQVFVGRKGKMPVTKGTLQEQLMDSVDMLTEGWSPSTPTPTPTPEPSLSYTVKFVVDTTKATYTGNLSQEVAVGEDATAPAVTPKEGWAFKGWDKAFTNVTADLTVTAQFEATPTEADVRAEAYGTATKLTAMVTDTKLGVYFGTATISLGKISKKGTVKATAKIALFNGKSYSASKTVTVAKNGGAADTFSFKSPVGTMHFEMGYDASTKSHAFTAEGDGWEVAMVDGTIGGKIGAAELAFSANISLNPPEGYDFVTEVPSEEPVYVTKGTKLSFNKVPTIKYQRYKEDGETWYELVINDAKGTKTNTSGLKLIYKEKTGIFSGSFKVYASNENSIAEGKKPTLKKYTATVKGVVVDGIGYGAVIIKVGNLSSTGSCTFR